VQELGAQLEENGNPATATPPLDDSGFVDLVAAGTHVSGEFRCADCGYGAVVQRALPPCPMCGGTVWENRAGRARLGSWASRIR
jgi:rubrerythrin